uniref:Tetraspanin n=1 Tax=Dipetalogaster maximus TaxID=72496 RepID=G3CJT8_DIPMA
MEACGMSFIKYLLFIFNLLFAISGLAVLIVGAVVLSNIGEFERYVDSTVLGPPIVLIVVGAVIFLIASLGCCGAIKENYYLLIVFAILLGVIFIMELAVGIAASVAKDDFTTALRSSLEKSMSNYTISSADRESWDGIQKSLKCCGISNPKGWENVVGADQVPITCCRTGTAPTPSSSPPTCPFSTDQSLVFQEGCYDKIKMKIKDNIIIIMGIGIGIAFIELAGIVLAVCLAATIKKEQEEK